MCGSNIVCFKLFFWDRHFYILMFLELCFFNFITCKISFSLKRFQSMLSCCSLYFPSAPCITLSYTSIHRGCWVSPLDICTSIISIISGLKTNQSTVCTSIYNYLKCSDHYCYPCPLLYFIFDDDFAMPFFPTTP